jgi:DNA primase
MGQSVLLYKTNCPNPAHADPSPSFGVYDDGHGYCYGCQAHVPTLS